MNKMASENDIMMNSTNSSEGIEEIPEDNQKVFTIVLYVLVGSVGILGNSMVCVVFSLVRSRRSQVNLFILHQAIVDLCTSCLLIMFGITQLYRDEIMKTSYEPLNASSPTTNSSDLMDDGASQEYVKVANISLPLAEFMCRLWWGRVFLFSMFAISTFNLMSMAIERYMAIMHPFFYATKFKRRHTLIVIIMAWLFAPILQYFPPIFQYDAMDDTHECGIQTDFSKTAQAAIGICLISWEFIMPSIVMGFSSIKIFRELRYRDSYLVKATNYLVDKDKRTPQQSEPEQETMRANRNTTMVVIVIFVVYIICWAPNHFTFLGFNLGMELDFTGKWYHTTVLLAFVNSCTNPFIYAIRLKTFQRGLVHICRLGCHPISSARFDSQETTSRYRVNASVL
ncbi:galanin receptor 2a-like [Lytechinus variegatus]|uniref:galanin receptor 2a-like n=1 Tax=Lytechinus variegatus TaxID=7654 RepID=UPI001BB2D08A|nr:galanin receptor 2a-like [Lytechinus variegatus]XP_041483031.1 galanin receptor 2a-like [Lytechinus variegatus]XP_041483032.1 galanin receptor 2a-like [Lytechinus variegatus]XP_041483033.1 galanin receptor 2a-like [Lytechinus variegatus]XP_041483034.1 galanin receptor 2a-like [Lytechinus variegatus]